MQTDSRFPPWVPSILGSSGIRVGEVGTLVVQGLSLCVYIVIMIELTFFVLFFENKFIFRFLHGCLLLL